MYRATTSFTTNDYDVRYKEILEDNFTTTEQIQEFLRIGYIEVYDDTLEITENGEYDVEDYLTADVNVPSGEPTLQSKTVTLTENGTTTVQADSGYDGLSSVEVDVDVPSGSQFVFNSPDISGLNEVFYPTTVAMVEAYLDYVDKQLPIYLNEPVTIYTPDINMQDFFIQRKTTGNEYRIIWTNGKISSVVRLNTENNSSLYLYSSIDAYQSYSTQIYGSTCNLRGFANVGSTTSSAGSWYSKSFNTLNDLIEAITNPNSEMNYQHPNNSSYYSNDYSFSIITNSFVWLYASTGIDKIMPIRKLSNNITILPLS